MKRTPSTHCGRYEPIVNRRQLLQRAGGGAGLLALGNLLHEQSLLAGETEAGGPLAPKAGHFPAKAKSVIWLFMEGAPSAVDLFDPKPELTKRDGQRTDIKVFFGDPGPLMKSPFKFQQYGECGQSVCEKYTNVAKHVDEIAFIKSCYSESDNHVPALYQINTGLPRPGFPRPVRGSPTAWAVKTRTCRAMSCWATIKASKGGRSTGCGFPAHHLSRHAVSQSRQPGAQPEAAQ